MDLCNKTESLEPQAKKLKTMLDDDVNTETQTTDLDSNDKFDFPNENNYLSDILMEIDYGGDGLPSVTDRYFTPYYRINVTKPGDDLCIWIHSNRICMIGLSPNHVVFKSDKIVNVNFKVSNKLDRTNNKVSGKGKHGAQPLQENSNICIITTSDNESHVIKCGMIGKLIEVNERLIEEPQLLQNLPHRGGYLAIILLNLKQLDKMKKSLLTKEEYDAELRRRDEERKD